MYFVLSKEKIYAYIVSILTVIVLFGIALINNKEYTVETVSNVEKVKSMDDLRLEKKKVVLIKDCDCSEDDINNILQELEKSNVKVILFLLKEDIDNNNFEVLIKNIENKEYEILKISNLINRKNN